MANEWLQKAQLLKSKRGEDNENSTSPAILQENSDFRNLLRKANNPSSTPEPNLRTSASAPTKISWGANRLSYGKAPNTPTPSPSSSQDKVPAWKIRLEAQKTGTVGESPTFKPNNNSINLPTDVKELRAKLQEESDMRKKAQNKFQLSLFKIQEAKKMFQQALELLSDTELVLQLELKEQEEYDSISQLPLDEQERAKEEEWKKWIGDIEKRKKEKEEKELLDHIDNKKQKKEKKAKKDKRKKDGKNKDASKERKKNEKENKDNLTKLEEKSQDKIIVKPQSDKITEDRSNKSKFNQPQPKFMVPTVSKNNEVVKKETNESNIKVESNVEEKKTEINEIVSSGEEPKKASLLRGMFEQKAIEKKVVSEPVVKPAKTKTIQQETTSENEEEKSEYSDTGSSYDEDEEDDNEDDDNEESESSSEEEEKEKPLITDESVIEF